MLIILNGFGAFINVECCFKSCFALHQFFVCLRLRARKTPKRIFPEAYPWLNVSCDLIISLKQKMQYKNEFLTPPDKL